MVQIFKDANELSAAAAKMFVQASKEAIAEKGSFTVVLTGGSSPIKLHQLLATPAYREEVDWANVYIFWGDERWVSMEDERSNAKMAFDTLLNFVPVPSGQIYPMYDAANSPEEYAVIYEQLIRDVVDNDGVFDLILLGMGDDGHTASLFPGTAILKEETKWVDAYYLEPQEMYRITLTAPLINRAKKLVVMTFGEKKTHALHEVLEGEHNPELYPSQLLKPVNGELTFMVDEVAASQLSEKRR
ncbi:6-phosphogluconolactonase [Mucilaginibacter galii]|uniref:6-phosphogluconolactonase n=1 Tax=Mucilaginibacter galii TaxID=2005073 RepID=A0A917JBL0_9SPHI|nr:6-phosphogluconolactonase [Mucilaginibacter galii]GGI52643.1 6-phosphogluconolactonase [Mucilaginibacter galii]